LRIIAGRWRGHPLKAPRGRDTRPTTDRVREAWFSALGDSVVDARVLDLFAGSGALGLEAVSRGAEHAVFVERSRGAVRCIEANVDRLGVRDRCTVVHGNALEYLERLEPEAFSIVLADPPYGQGLAADLVSRFLREPFANQLWVEHRRSDEVPESPGARTRRYGDTVLTTVWATP
jgi:16S rRNA (guanine966-N2)-methyltransferase